MRNRKLVAFITVLLLVVIGTQVYASGATGVKIQVNGKPLAVKAKIIDNKVYVPLKETFEGLGAIVGNSAVSGTYTINLSKDDERIPKIISKLSKSVLGVIGTLKDDQSNSSDETYVENIAHGTGVIIKSTGEILTNAHVVQDMDKIVVVLSDGRGYEATIKYIDENADLALIKIPTTKLVPATLGSEKDIVIGRGVIAIGTPVSFSLMNSSTTGIISGLNRGNSSDSYYKLIQTDASINPGNSGGPLVSMDGKVIGINSSKYMGEGIEGIGFSIPVNTINYVLKQFYAYGKVKRPYLGTDFEEDWIAKIGLPSTNGLKIVDVAEGSPGSKAGIKIDDMLISINNVKINAIIDFNEEMKKYKPGSKVSVKYKSPM